MCLSLLFYVCVSFVLGYRVGEPLRRLRGGDVADLRGSGHAGILLVTCTYPRETRAWTCGGSVIHPRIILTAAHCLNVCLNISSVRFFTGNLIAFAGKAVDVPRFIGHARNSAANAFAYDIAVGLTATSMPIGEYVHVLTVTKTYTGFTLGEVSGWGVKEIEGKPKLVLKKLRVPFVKTSRCNHIFKTSITAGTFCAGLDTINYISFGDSGCGLVSSGSLVGMVTGGYPATRLAPTIYTNLTHHYSWLQAATAALLQHR